MCSPIEIFIETRIPFCVIIEILHIFCVPSPVWAFARRPGSEAASRNAICSQRAFRLRLASRPSFAVHEFGKGAFGPTRRGSL